MLKIVDFGVSEMFDKEGEMKTAKSAGSPAFMPPELCVAKHGHVSGRAADIWSMGCTLYCLLFGRIPFEKRGMIELYQNDGIIAEPAGALTVAALEQVKEEIAGKSVVCIVSGGNNDIAATRRSSSAAWSTRG